MALGDRIQARLDAMGKSQNWLARQVGVSAQTIWKLVNGHSHSTGHLHKIARVLETTPEYLDGETDDDSPRFSMPVTPIIPEPDPDFVEIDALDLQYGMGGTFLDGNDFPHVEKMRFERAWIERFTKSPPEMLFLAEGTGDSMMPTIFDADMVLVDRAESRMRMGDKVWAISFGGVGMIKRLRPMPDGTVKIMSDNPSVSEDRATDGDLHIIGRVVAVIRKM